MGLDMYLYRTNKEFWEVMNTKGFKDASSGVTDDWGKKYAERFERESIEVAYWRKANAIHNWFDKKFGGIRNCDEVRVSKEDLEELVGVCKEVLGDLSKAPDMLPTTRGFFFGEVEYDEWYTDHLKSTIAQAEKVIEETDWETQIVYYHPWW